MRRSAGFLFSRVLLFRRVAGTGQDRESRILGKTRIGEGEFAQEEAGAASGLDPASVKAIGAQTGRAVLLRCVLLLTHECRISQDAVLTHAVES